MIYLSDRKIRLIEASVRIRTHVNFQGVRMGWRAQSSFWEPAVGHFKGYP